MLMDLGNCFLEFKLSKLSSMFFLHAFWVTPSASEDFPRGSDSKESACNAGDQGSIPGLGRSPGGGHGNPLQYSCLENPMDRGAWWATVHRVTRSQTQLKQRSNSKCLWTASTVLMPPLYAAGAQPKGKLGSHCTWHLYPSSPIMPILVGLLVHEAHEVTCSFDKILSFCTGLQGLQWRPGSLGPPTPLCTAGRPHLAATAPMILKREPGSATQGQVLSWSRLVQEGGHPSPAVHCDLRPRNFRKHTLFKCPAVPWKSTAYTHVSLP